MEKTFKYVELFAGIGGFRSALDGLGGECVMASEIDVFATKAYRALYNGAPELRGDVTKIDTDDIPDHDLLVGGFPCQAFSVAGQRRGFEEARGTLFFEIARIASAKRPAFMMLENVKGLLSHDGGNTFSTMATVLNDIGYAMDFTVLNSKHFGVPQNRERIIIVCSRDAEHADWTPVGTGVVSKAKRRIAELGVRTFNFDWPTNDTVTTRLRDVLETNVAERYYLSDAKTATLLAQLDGHKSIVEDVVCVNPRKPDGTQTYQQDRTYDADGVMTTLSAELGGRFNIVEPFCIDDQGRTTKRLRPLEIVPTLRAQTHGNEPRIVEAQDAESPIVVGSLEHYGNDQMNRVYSVDGISPTITVVSGGGREQKIAEPQNDGIEIVGRLDDINGHDLCKRVYGSDGIAPTIPTGSSGNTIPKIAVENVGNVNPSGNGMNGSVYADSGLAPTLTTNKGEGPKVLTGVEYNRKDGIGRELEAAHTLSAHTLSASDWRGLNRNQTQNAVLEVRAVLTPDRPEKHQNGRRFKEDGEPSFTLTAQDKHGVAIGAFQRYRIRKLTPLECWRLQAFTDEQFETVKYYSTEEARAMVKIGKRDIPYETRIERISDSQLYKMAGNAVTVSVIRAVGIPLVALLATNPEVVAC